MQKFLSTKQAADYMKELGVPFTPGTLEVWRCQGRGPRFKKIGRRVFYEKPSLDDFLRGETVETVDSFHRKAS